MVDTETFKKLVLSYPETIELPHFEKTSFRAKKKIFATLDTTRKIACLKLSEIDQSVFSDIDKSIIYPVSNKWGKQGWTYVELKKVKKSVLKDALAKSFIEVTATKPPAKK
ncbi:MAG: MmcQ/YjbR family DNA-binding protein [Ferruginibacter sp.]